MTREEERLKYGELSLRGFGIESLVRKRVNHTSIASFKAVRYESLHLLSMTFDEGCKGGNSYQGRVYFPSVEEIM